MTDFSELLRAAEAEDGVAPLSEQFVRGLDDATLNHTHHTIDGADGVALAAVAPDGGVELVVHPEHRRRGHARELIAQVGDAGTDFWAHGNLPAAQALAAELGMEPARELLVMAIDAADIELTGRVPEGFELMTYREAVERWGTEDVDKRWLDVNNDAFSWHPEQGGWDLGRLRRGMETDWFDADGVFLLYRGDELAGFHWTKRHPGETGEVYVIGVASAFRGEGMGVPLLEAGLKYLLDNESSQVILYVEADNAPAVKRYTETGFTIAESHVVYRFSGS